MFCKKCGSELEEGVKFCKDCGEAVSVETSELEVEEFTTPQTPRVPKCFTIFGKVGYGLSLAGFICAFIPYVCMVGMEIALTGLVFSILGKKDVTLFSKTKKGRIFGILGLVIGFVMTIITVVILVLLTEEVYYY